MDALFSYFVLEITALLLGLTALYQLFNPFSYWEKRGIPYSTPQVPLIGSFLVLFRRISDLSLARYKSFPHEKFYGGFSMWRPNLVVKDPELIEAILIKDFANFCNRGNVADVNTNEVSKHLLNFQDENWRALRNKLTPTFTSGKLKGMHPQLVEKAESLLTYLNRFTISDPVEMKDLSGRFTMDVIASCAFGLDLDIMNNPGSEFFKVGKQMFIPSWIIKCIVVLQPILKGIYKMLGIGIISKKFTSFFVDAIDQTLEYRKTNNVNRPDFLHLLNELKEKDDELVKTNQLNPKEQFVFDKFTLVSNAFIFFAAGYETTATTISFLFYQLALNPDIQEKVHKEIVDVLEKHKGELSSQAIEDMKYLDHAIAETLRIHPPAVMLDRKCKKDYQMPGTEFILPAGTTVLIPIYGLHRDPQYFPDPEKFDPDRFDPEKNTIVKGTYLPFGAGPRTCIAARFAKLEIKVCMSKVLKNFKVKTCSKTKIPLDYDPRTFLLNSRGGVYVSFEKR